MRNSSVDLARSITQSSSKQSYTIARLLVDKDLVDDCLRAYAYFRWADDEIDVSAQSAEERIAFVKRQKRIIDALYNSGRNTNLKPEEKMIADLIAHDRGENSGLQSYIRGFMEVLEFDARRKDKLISEAELAWYSRGLGKAVTDAIQYFIGHDHVYAKADKQYLAATAAHITHMLRDMCEDINEGFINIPSEWLLAHGFASKEPNIDLEMMKDPAFRGWVRGQVELARTYFREGKQYLDQLPVLRCKIAAYWYCARFECVLDSIERDGFTLRPEYHERNKLSFKLKMGWLAISLTIQHFVQGGRSHFWGGSGEPDLERPATEHYCSEIIESRSK
jgi:phytoene/squalene synthetase